MRAVVLAFALFGTVALGNPVQQPSACDADGSLFQKYLQEDHGTNGDAQQQLQINLNKISDPSARLFYQQFVNDILVLGARHRGEQQITDESITADDVQLYSQLFSQYSNLSSAAKQSLATALPNTDNFLRVCMKLH